MSKQMNSEILDALLKAANAAEQAGDFRLADRTDELAQRVAQSPIQPALQLVKKVGEPALKYLGNDQIAGPAFAPVTNAIEGKGLFDDALKDTPSSMVGIGSGNYVQSYLANPMAWFMDLVPATNKLRFMNMIRSELISSGFTELTDNRIWKAFAEQKGQGGLEELVRTYSQQADRLLGPVKNAVDAETRLGKMVQWVKNIPQNKIIGMRQFFVRNFGSLAPNKGGWSLANDRANRANEYMKSKGVQNADEALSTQELIKKNRLNLDEHGFDRSKLDTSSPKTPKTPKAPKSSAIKGVNSVTGKASSAKDLVQKAGQYLKERPELMKQALSKAGKTEEGAKWLKFLKSNSKDATKVGKGMKALGRIAMVIAIADIISDIPGAASGDARSQLNIYINTLGLAFPPLAIATALTSLFGIDLSDEIITNLEVWGEKSSGVDMAQTTEDLINAGMTYNPKTKEWEGGGYERSFNEQTGQSFEADMMNMVKSGMSINQAWAITLKKMKAAGSTPEEILTARQKYNQAKTMIYNEGMIGSMKAPVWSAEQITKFEQSLNKHLAAKLQSGVPYSDLLREIDSYMRKVPNLRMINAIRSRIVDNLNAAQKSIEKGEKPVAPHGKQNTTTQGKVDNSLMSTAQRSRGTRVAAWQQFLAQNGFFPGYNQKTPPVFGPRTTRATRAFQSKYNLRVDGVVGPETLGKARQLGGKL